MIDALPLLLAPEGYQISRSVRLRSSASAYLSRTPASAGNRKTWTWSGWVKRGALGSPNFTLFSRYVDANNFAYLRFTSIAGDELRWYEAATGAAVSQRDTTQVLRDPSAFYHIVIAYDTTQAVAADRVKIYANGNQITAFATTVNRTQNADGLVNAAAAHQIGALNAGAFFDGYLTEVNFIDGQALDHSYFGETNPVTGVWQPKKYTGTYGTNGFYLNFSDNSAATAAAIGKDYSGNGNNWTPNNISVTAGATYDSMLDVPTLWGDGGNGRGNYATLNPIKLYTNNFSFSQGNLQVTDATANTVAASASMRTPTSGKWYWEVTATTISGALGYICAAGESTADANAAAAAGFFRSNGTIGNLANVLQTSGSSYTSGDVIGIAVDVDAGTCQFYKNGVAQGATPSFSFTAGTVIVPLLATDNAAGTKTFHANFGQRPFAYTPPTGFKALNTQNLPTPTILKGNQYFDATLYTGNGSTQSIVNAGGMQPDLVWLKSRSAANSHFLADAARGADGSGYYGLQTNTTNAELTGVTNVTALNSNGFTLGSNAGTNGSGATFVGWQWKEGATQGFDIVTYTGNGSATQTINHSLGVVPRMIIVKNRSNLAAWPVYHASIGNGNKLVLNATSAQAATGNWASTNPTSAQFYVGGPSSEVNTSSENYVAYLFSEVAGFSRFGSYTGNGSADGPFVFCGFLPRFVLVKCTSAVGDWTIVDTARNAVNLSTATLFPNASAAEGTGFQIDITSNGFKLRNTGQNTSGATYVFAAFASNPFKNALAR